MYWEEKCLKFISRYFLLVGLVCGLIILSLMVLYERKEYLKFEQYGIQTSIQECLGPSCYDHSFFFMTPKGEKIISSKKNLENVKAYVTDQILVYDKRNPHDYVELSEYEHLEKTYACVFCLTKGKFLDAFFLTLFFGLWGYIVVRWFFYSFHEMRVQMTPPKKSVK